MTRSNSQARARSSPGSRTTKRLNIASYTSKNQGGGNKKQGLAPSVGTGSFSLWGGMRRAGSTPAGRAKVFCINQLGNIGMMNYQTRSPSDGVRRPCQGMGMPGMVAATLAANVEPMMMMPKPPIEPGDGYNAGPIEPGDGYVMGPPIEAEKWVPVVVSGPDGLPLHSTADLGTTVMSGGGGSDADLGVIINQAVLKQKPQFENPEEGL